MKRLFPLTCLIVCAPLPAFAHIGHVAEVAGHGHLVAVGAVVAAAVLGGLIAKIPKKQEIETEAETDPDTVEEDAVGDVA
ncbi:MAG: DUF6732 family protein [Hyphomicrobiales bacterium]